MKCEDLLLTSIYFKSNTRHGRQY